VGVRVRLLRNDVNVVRWRNLDRWARSDPGGL